MKKKVISVLKLFFFLGLGALFIWLFVKDLTQNEVTEIFSAFRNADYLWVIITLFIAVISHIMRTLRWQMLIRPLGYQTGFKNVFMALMIGYFANLALPRLGEVTRCSVLAKYEKVPFQKGLGTVVAERAFDVICFLVLFVINLIVQYDLIHHYVMESVWIPLKLKFSVLGQGYLLYGILGAVVLFILLFLLFRKKLENFSLYRKITGIFRGFLEGIRSLGRIRRAWLFLTYTVLMWLMYYLMTYLCFYSIAGMGDAGMLAGFSVLVLGTIGIMVVQGGIGIYPAIVAETLVLYGAVSTTAYALGWLIWSAQTAALVLAGLVSLILLPILNKNNHGKPGSPETENPVG